MRLAVVGGKLQGTEAAYLGLKAGYDVVLVDRRPGMPASGLAAETHVFDICAEDERARRLFMGCDAVLPACEDDDTLGLAHRARGGVGRAAALRPACLQGLVVQASPAVSSTTLA